MLNSTHKRMACTVTPVSTSPDRMCTLGCHGHRAALMFFSFLCCCLRWIWADGWDVCFPEMMNIYDVININLTSGVSSMKEWGCVCKAADDWWLWILHCCCWNKKTSLLALADTNSFIHPHSNAEMWNTGSIFFDLNLIKTVYYIQVAHWSVYFSFVFILI